MNILILTNTFKLNEETQKELCHLDGSVYIQYIDTNINKPVDISLVSWDVLIVDKGVHLTPEWNYFLAKHTNNFVLSKFIYENQLPI